MGRAYYDHFQHIADDHSKWHACANFSSLSSDICVVQCFSARMQKNDLNSLPILEGWLGFGRHNINSNELRLASAAKRGDRRAFDALVAIHETPLRGFVTRRLASHLVDDVLQDIWLAAWNSIGSFKGRSRFKAWLYQIAVHKCADTQRAKMIPTLPIHEPYVEANLPGTSFHEGADNRHDVNQALLALPDSQREVLELYYYADLTLAEISGALGRNLNTVKYHFYKAHATVADILQDREDGAFGQQSSSGHGKTKLGRMS
jgi:RNA polymerase sigma-70 factor (ECF subfamily)